jgi:hypothetical protein
MLIAHPDLGSTEEVMQPKVLSKGMPGGGYILSSSKPIHSAVKPITMPL